MIDTCVNCDYSLKGLPANPRCPECGLAYDEQSEIYRITHRGAWINGICASALGLWGLYRSSSVFKRAGPAMDLVVAFGVAIFVAGMAWAAYVAFNLARRGQFVGTLPDFLLVRIERMSAQHISWNELSRASVGKGFIGATLFLKHKKTTRDIRGVFKTREDAARFVDQVNDRIARANAKETNSPDSPDSATP